MVPVKKILGKKVLQHFSERMEQRKLTIEDIEKVLLNPDIKKKQPWRDRVVIQKHIDRGYVTVILNSSEKGLKTCWVT